ncbi:MAG: glycosyltransferase family 39 protein [Pirellulales bacterium]|nr:glycosyltransferase family 39 protein [Pirellulales bacterium]
MPEASQRDCESAARWPLGCWQLFSLAVVLLTALLAASRWEILRWPPYWDFAIGLWAEASFLADTDFDYARLRYEERPIGEGGTRCYVTSIVPTLVAIAMRTLPSSASVLLVAHLVTLACSAILLVLVIDLLRQRCGTVAAVLAAGCVATTPMFSAQMEMLGMDLPLALCCTLALWSIDRERPAWACAAAAVAFLVKATGSLVAVALLAYWIGGLVLARHTGRRPPVVWMLVAALLVVCETAAISWGGQLGWQMTTAFRSRDLGLAAIWTWCPDLGMGYLAASALAVVWSVVAWRRGTLGQHFAQNGAAVFAAILCVGMLWSITRIIFLPRYLLPTVPLLWIFLTTALAAQIAWRLVPIGILAVCCALNLGNQYGRFYPDLIAAHGERLGRTGALLERSLEYRADQRANLAAVRALVAANPQEPILAAWPFPHMLAMPRLGFVERPLSGYSVNGFSRAYPAFQDIEQAVFVDRPQRIIVVDEGNSFSEYSRSFVLPSPQTGEELLFDDRQASPLVVFRPTLPAGDAEGALARWYLDRLWTPADPVHWALLLRDYYEQRDDPLRAARVLRETLVRIPQADAIEQAYLRWLFDHGCWFEAANLCLDRATRIDTSQTVQEWSRREGHRRPAYIPLPGTPRRELFADPAAAELWLREELKQAQGATHDSTSVGRQALLLLAQGDVQGADRVLTKDHRRQPLEGLAALVQGLIDLHSGRTDAAVASLARAGETAPPDALPGLRAQAATALGVCRLSTGEMADAERHFRAALELAPDEFFARQGLANVLARLGRWDEAFEQAAAAAGLRPENSEIAALLRQIEQRRPSRPAVALSAMVR